MIKSDCNAVWNGLIHRCRRGASACSDRFCMTNSIESILVDRWVFRCSDWSSSTQNAEIGTLEHLVQAMDKVISDLQQLKFTDCMEGISEQMNFAQECIAWCTKIARVLQDVMGARSLFAKYKNRMQSKYPIQLLPKFELRNKILNLNLTCKFKFWI